MYMYLIFASYPILSLALTGKFLLLFFQHVPVHMVCVLFARMAHRLNGILFNASKHLIPYPILPLAWLANILLLFFQHLLTFSILKSKNRGCTFMLKFFVGLIRSRRKFWNISLIVKEVQKRMNHRDFLKLKMQCVFLMEFIGETLCLHHNLQ